MNNHFTRFGLIYGLASIIITLSLYFIDPKLMMTYTSWIIYLIALYFMVQAVQFTKSDTEGFITLGEAFKQSWLVFVTGISLHTLFSFVLYNYVDSSLLDILRETQIEALEKMAKTFNMSEADMAKTKSGIDSQNPFDLKSVIIALPVSFLFPGALIAIVIAAIMKRDKPVY